MRTLSGKNVMVAGGAGFIGSHLVDRIICEQPARLVVVDNFFLGKEKNLEKAYKEFPGIQVIRIDASSMSAMRQVVESNHIEVVFDLAVIPLPTSLIYPEWTIRTNIQIATTFCELARQGAIDTLIYCSSSEAYGSAVQGFMDEKHPLGPTTPYAASKASADLIVQSYYESFGINTTIVRPFNNFGPRQNSGTYAGIIPIVINCVKEGRPIEIYGDGFQTRDYIYVRYTVEAFIRIYECETTRGKAINVATSSEITINELVNRLITIMGAGDHHIIHTLPRQGDVRRHRGDIRLLRELTGYHPNPISDDDLEETIQWYLESSI